MDNITGVKCIVDIYPYEAGGTSGQQSYTISSDLSNGTHLLSVSTTKNLYEGNGGKFNINIVPGGPNGTNDVTTWTQIIPLLSLVVIYMERGDSVGIPIIGVVTEVGEGQNWEDDRIYRTLNISGQDLTYFFSQFGYWNQFFMGVSPNPAVQSLKFNEISGNPNSIGINWFAGIFLQVLGGVTFNIPNNGQITVNGPSSVASVPIPPGTNAWNQYQSGKISGTGGPSFQPLTLNNLFGYWFDSVTYNGTNYTIPLDSNLIMSEGTWFDKFKDIFQFPFYEFFVMVLPVDSGNNPITLYGANTPITLACPTTFSYNGNSFGIFVVARMNTNPTLVLNASSDFQSPFYTSDVNNCVVNTDIWDDLVEYSPDTVFLNSGNYNYSRVPIDPSAMFSSNLSFNLDDFYNFYVFNSTSFMSLLGSTNPGSPNYMNWPFIMDNSSMARYGWRPMIFSTTWYSDLNQTNNHSYLIDIGQMDLVLSSYYSPKPTMGNTIYSGPLRPDILPGNKFTYNPFKDTSLYDPSLQSNTWDFYIEEVTHQYVFAGKSSTTLKLTRGLPSSIYNREDSENLLQGILSGTVHRYLRDFGNNQAYGAYGPLQNYPPNMVTKIGTYLQQITSRALQEIGNFFYNPVK